MPTFPVIHLNGSGKQNLLDQLGTAAKSLYDSVSALQQAAPHQRDYYINDPDGSKFAAAQKEHRDRLDRLSSVLEELQEIAINISQQPGR